MNLEKYFERYRDFIIGRNQVFNSPFGEKQIIYADWIASGRLYQPIEKVLQDKVLEVDADQARVLISSGKAVETEKALTKDNKDDSSNAPSAKDTIEEIKTIDSVEELEKYLTDERKSVINAVQKRMDEITDKQ